MHFRRNLSMKPQLSRGGGYPLRQNFLGGFVTISQVTGCS